MHHRAKFHQNRACAWLIDESLIFFGPLSWASYELIVFTGGPNRTRFWREMDRLSHMLIALVHCKVGMYERISCVIFRAWPTRLEPNI